MIIGNVYCRKSWNVSVLILYFMCVYSLKPHLAASWNASVLILYLYICLQSETPFGSKRSTTPLGFSSTRLAQGLNAINNLGEQNIGSQHEIFSSGCGWKCCFSEINSSPPSAVYMHWWNGSALVQIMACRLDSTKPLSKPVLTYCQLEPKEHISMKFYLKFKYFHSIKYVWTYRLRNGSHFSMGDELVSGKAKVISG